jgi:hypothetical protein
MICSVTDQNCIQPYPFLCSVEPFVLEAILTNRTNGVDAPRWIRNGDVFWLGGLRCFGGLRGSVFNGWDVVYVDDLS